LLLSAVIHYLERLIDFWRETGGFVAGNQKLLSEIIWPHFWAIQIILFVLIAAYCMVHELVGVIGKGKDAADILRSDACAASLSEAFMAETKKNGWTVIRMKDDWKTIFAFEKN
jgi:hypothetical protein